MKKIMFSDKCRLTQAVLDGRKTQTRRIAYISQHDYEMANGMYPDAPLDFKTEPFRKSKYKVGETVAIAQSYKDCGYDPNMLQQAVCHETGNIRDCPISELPGWKNKLFTYPTMMQHHIFITGLRIERLQDISDEDCIKEGIAYEELDRNIQPLCYFHEGSKGVFTSFQSAYAHLIDKISGKGTWERNPYVFVYDFERID